MSVFSHRFRHRIKLCSARELSCSDCKRIGSFTSRLIVKAYPVFHARLKTEVLRDRLIDHTIILCQSVCLDRPVAVQNIVHFLYIPSSLRIWFMQFGQVGAVIRNSLGASDNKRVDTLCVVLEILLHSDNVSVLILLHDIHLGLNYADIVEVGASFSSFSGKRQRHCSALRRGKEYIHVLEITGAVYSCAGIAVRICLYIALRDRLFRIVSIQDLSVRFNSNRSFRFAPVVHAHIDRVFLTRSQVCQFLGHGNFAVHLQHRVAVLALRDLC